MPTACWLVRLACPSVASGFEPSDTARAGAGGGCVGGRISSSRRILRVVAPEAGGTGSGAGEVTIRADLRQPVSFADAISYLDPV